MINQPHFDLPQLIIKTVELSNLHHETIIEFLRLYDLQNLSQIQISELRRILADKLLEIIHFYGENYINFLDFFSPDRLNPGVKKIIIYILGQIWRKVQSDRNKNIFIQNEVSKLLPLFENIQEIQNFHFKMYKDYKDSRILQNNLSQNEQFPEDQRLYYYPHNCLHSIDPNTQLQKENIQINNTPYSSNFQSNNSNSFEQNVKIEQSPENEVQNQQIQMQNQENYSQLSQGHSNQLRDQKNENNFRQCLCGGKQEIQQNFFVCSVCEECFHYKCLRIRKQLIQNYHKCPSCKLMQSKNIFLRIIPSALLKRWHHLQYNFKLNFSFTENQLNAIEQFRKKYYYLNSQFTYHLKLLRLSVQNQVPSENIEIKKSSKIKMHNTVLLPDHYMQNIRKNNDISINFQLEDNINLSKSYIFFGIYLVQKMTPKSLNSELFSNLNEQNSVGEEYLKKFFEYFKQPKQKIKAIDIKLTMISKTSQNGLEYHQILYPVRGNNCKHPQVFDHLQILSQKKFYYSSQLQIFCPICGLQCERFIADRFIYEKLNEHLNKQYKQRKNNKKMIQTAGMRYHNNKFDVQWIKNIGKKKFQIEQKPQSQQRVNIYQFDKSCTSQPYVKV